MDRSRRLHGLSPEIEAGIDGCLVRDLQEPPSGGFSFVRLRSARFGMLGSKLGCDDKKLDMLKQQGPI
jgi:hypothetical protein